jgi:prolyl-tRNA editing enzyme YbaK/EbsC (Cys-tRNA(Pro) deacylase)
MTKRLKSSAQKVQDCIQQQGYSFSVREFSSSTRTAKDAADSIGCIVGQIAKSLIFKDKFTGKPILVVASGSNQVDTKKIQSEVGLRLSRADADYVREHVGYAIGGIPPIAHKTKLRVLLEEDLKTHKVIWAAAGTPNAVFELSPQTLEELTNGAWMDLAR